MLIVIGILGLNPLYVVECFRRILNMLIVIGILGLNPLYVVECFRR